MKITYTNCCSSMMKITSKLSLLYRRKLMIKINYHYVIKLRSVYHEVLPQGPCNGCITPRWVYCDASPPCRCIVMHFLVVGVSWYITLRSVYRDTLPLGRCIVTLYLWVDVSWHFTLRSMYHDTLPWGRCIMTLYLEIDVSWHFTLRLMYRDTLPWDWCIVTLYL